MTTRETTSGTTDGRTRRSITLGEAFAEFRSWPTPRILAAALVTTLVARGATGGFGRADAVLVAVVLVAQPFVEWVLHVALLHMKPVAVGSLTVDPLVARDHRRHHADPRETALVFIPTPVLWQALAAIVAVALLAFPTVALGLTFATVMAVIGLAYEWTHFLIHSDYRPKRRLYRTIWRQHRLHHFKNERYWFGITGTYADHALRTTPDPATVETSPTVRDLLGSGRPG